MRPSAGVISLAPERVDPLDFWCIRRRQTARGHHAISRLNRFAASDRDTPLARRVVEGGGFDARIELDVAAQVEPVGDVIGVTQNFRLGRIPLAPVPLLLKFLRKLVGIFHALHIAARAWIAVPIPSAADAASGFENARGQSQLSRTVEHVHAREPGPDDRDINAAAIFRGTFHFSDHVSHPMPSFCFAKSMTAL